MRTGGLAALHSPQILSPTRVLPDWFRERFQTTEPMISYRKQVARTRGTLFGVWSALLCITFVWTITTDGAFIRIDGWVTGGIPIGIAPAFAFIATLSVLAATAQWWSRAERRTAQRGALRVFAVGTFPTTRTYLIVRTSDLVVVQGDNGGIAVVDWSRIDVAALEGSWFGVGVSLSIDGAWYDIPIVLEAGGPVADHWGREGRSATKRLLAAVQSSLDGRVPVFLA